MHLKKILKQPGANCSFKIKQQIVGNGCYYGFFFKKSTKPIDRQLRRLMNHDDLWFPFEVNRLIILLIMLCLSLSTWQQIFFYLNFSLKYSKVAGSDAYDVTYDHRGRSIDVL